MMKGTATKYGRMAQLLHWLSALLIIALWPLGFFMVRMSNSASQTRLYQVHVAIGLLVTLLTIGRVIWHFMDTVPPAPANLTPLNNKLFQWTHNLLYLVLLILAVSGMAMLLSSGLSILPTAVVPEAINDVLPRTGHSLASKLFALLFLAHVGGIVRYQLTKGDTMGRMGISLPSFKQ